MDSIAVEYDELSDERVERSLAEAEASVEGLVRSLAESTAAETRAA